MNDIFHLARLLSERNAIDAQISQLIQRPATQGHIGEFIASRVFDVRLMDSACNKAIDGHFASGPLVGRSVDVKFYSLQEGMLAIREDEQPDFFLVLTGPVSTAMSSQGGARPCVIEYVYVFDGRQLAQRLKARGAKFGVAASITQNEWKQAEIYPTQTSKLLVLQPNQIQRLALFGSSREQPRISVVLGGSALAGASLTPPYKT